MTTTTTGSPHQRRAIAVRGCVQGVGFRPFVYRLATDLNLAGWVNNTASGVTIEIEGDRDVLDEFQQRLASEPPPQARIEAIESRHQDPQFDRGFRVCHSTDNPTDNSADDPDGKLAARRLTLLPDLSICPDCLRELNDPQNRHYRYPFINCTNCGPRFSILRDLPYDRPKTTMADFALCPDCQAEYDDPGDRRFHAQPVACACCGPQLAFASNDGVEARGEAALRGAIAAIRNGSIVAVKGIGGFHLFADARNADTVATLRQRKARPDKPFALMYPDLAAIERDCRCSDADRALLTSMAAPIVLLPKRRERDLAIAPNVAPNVPDLGVMLPHAPHHHLLMQSLGFPIVATSANRSGEPLCTDGAQVRDRLGSVVDAILDSDRPIARPLDDSIVRVIANRPQVFRHGRGYAPTTLSVPPEFATDLTVRKRPAILALGAHLKNAIALSDGEKLILSQYIGDLNTTATLERLRATIDDLLRLYRIEPAAIACDAHPDYASTQLARAISRDRNLPIVPVQHHYAHALACMADAGVAGVLLPALAVTWDGTGYGLDGTAWGGEWLRVEADGWRRVAHWRSFPLPGGDVAAREPRRAALGWLFAVFGEDFWTCEALRALPTLAAFADRERSLLTAALTKRVNAPQTSSVGRMFDAVASLLGLCQTCSYEGQGAIAVEALVRGVDRLDRLDGLEPYPLEISQGEPGAVAIVESGGLLRGIVADLSGGVDRATIAAKFQQTLVAAIAEIARRQGLRDVLLTGGCFQNRGLSELATGQLEDLLEGSEGFAAHVHQRIPPNDGGLAIGQILAAWRALGRGHPAGAQR